MKLAIKPHHLGIGRLSTAAATTRGTTTAAASLTSVVASGVAAGASSFKAATPTTCRTATA